MFYEVTREKFASIVNPEPCRSGKTRVTVLVILCLLEWIFIGANKDDKILIISPLTSPPRSMRHSLHLIDIFILSESSKSFVMGFRQSRKILLFSGRCKM